MMHSTTAVRSTSHLRSSGPQITPALSAIAAVMNGVDPDPADVAELASVRISVETLHLAAAAALRKALVPFLLSRPAPGQPAQVNPEHRALLDAYHLAVELGRGGAGRLTPDRLSSALVIGAMQVRFLEAVCAQVEITAAPPKINVGARTPARTILDRGGELAPGLRLLADHTVNGSDKQEPWLHALSTVTVDGVVGRAVVDAGPVSASADVVARLAAPVTVTPAGGLWPVTVVADCLRICAPAVRRWVAAMPRELCGAGNRDIMLRSGAPLRDFLVSPATAAMTGSHGEASVLPIRAAVGVSAPASQPGLLAEMRTGVLPGGGLRPDVKLPAQVRIADLRRDELALLAAVPATDLGREVEVTVNFTVPEWKDITTLLEQIKAAGSLTLSEAVLGWPDRDIVAGQRQRVSLRVRVRRGVVCETRHGLSVLLPAGSTIALVGTDTSDQHTTLYGRQLITDPTPASSLPNCRLVAA